MIASASQPERLAALATCGVTVVGASGFRDTVLAATDHATITPATQVLIQAMREAGINVDAQSMDWGSVVSRRAKKEPPAQGGWNIFVTTSGGVGSAKTRSNAAEGEAVGGILISFC